VRSNREAPARTMGRAASLGGVGSPWPWAVLAWAALLVAIVASFRPAVPVIWGDTPAFVESAFRTLEAGKLTVAGGRDPGYPAFLAVTFAFGGDLGTVVRLQQAAWVLLMLALAATAQAATRNAGGLVPIILVATYPGLLLFRTSSPQSFSLRSSSIWQRLDYSLPPASAKRRGAARLQSLFCARRSRRASDRRDSWSQSSPSWWAPASPGQTRPRALP
jgi:hypothetical protein